MPSSRTGHFVQIWRTTAPYGTHVYVEVEGRTVAMSVNPDSYWAGWVHASRELPLKRATFYAKAYKRAGIKSRVIFQGHDGWRVIKEYEVK